MPPPKLYFLSKYRKHNSVDSFLFLPPFIFSFFSFPSLFFESTGLNGLHRGMLLALRVTKSLLLFSPSKLTKETYRQCASPSTRTPTASPPVVLAACCFWNCCGISELVKALGGWHFPKTLRQKWVFFFLFFCKPLPSYYFGLLP